MSDARRIILFFAVIISCIVIYFCLIIAQLARGRVLVEDPYNPNWVDQLSSKRGGICCFDNDGRRLVDPDWGIRDGHYWVRFPNEGELEVHEDAVVKQTNKDGIARVWSIVNNGKREIKCFLPGALG